MTTSDNDPAERPAGRKTIGAESHPVYSVRCGDQYDLPIEPVVRKSAWGNRLFFRQ